MLTAIIGGSGLAELEGLTITRREVMRTEYGEPSGPLTFGQISGREVVFLNRHGPGHTIPPHRVNYRANMFAMKQAGVERIIAINAVGGITDNLKAAGLVIPDQIIDYTYTREHTFYGSEHGPVKHVDFTYPYTENCEIFSFIQQQKMGSVLLLLAPMPQRRGQGLKPLLK